MELIIACLQESLEAISNPRFFETERGFQGELLVQLGRRMNLSERSIIEQEYQKRAQEHGLRIRPDIIIHEPFDPHYHANRAEGNHAALELKLNASREEAAQDFESLHAIIRTLNYPLGIFININSGRAFSELVPHEVRGRIVCFAVSQTAGTTTVIVERT